MPLCPLCEQNNDICESHILPSFVGKYLKDTSATGKLRHSVEPNIRRQDIIKHPLLCSSCEGTISVWEKEVAENLFLPLHENQSQKIFHYGDWLMKFCCSVSFRVLAYSIKENLIPHFTEDQRALAERALAAWRLVVLGKAKHPGEFEQHILPMGLVASGPSYLKDKTNLYISRSVSLDAVSHPKQVLVFGKMCALLCIGFIQLPPKNVWVGTKVHVNKGSLLGRYSAPAGFMRYFLEKCNTAGEVLDNLSERQKQKIDADMDPTDPKVANSKTVEAMYYDYLWSQTKKAENMGS